MASSSSKSVSSLLFIAAILISVALFPSPCHCSSSDHHQKVNLSVYYETLCPPCAQFIVENLINIFNNGIIDIVNLKLIPWGNAHLTVNGTNNTNNGPDECRLNRVQACVIDVLNNVQLQFKFIKCTEEQSSQMGNPSLAWKTCANNLQFPQMPIEDCYYNGMGKKLLLEYGDETMHLNPPSRGVPWVTVNGTPLSQDYYKFVSYVCKAYKGKSLPNACRTNRLNSKKETTVQPVCYRA
ncbi:Gamma-interferon-responsive lysosomal thiol protein [Linum perenne]